MILKHSLYGAVKLTKNPGPNKFSCSGYDVSFDVWAILSLPSGGFGKNRVISGPDMSSSGHV